MAQFSMSLVALSDNFSNKIGKNFGKNPFQYFFWFLELLNNTMALIWDVIETKHVTPLVTRIQNMLISLSVTLFVIMVALEATIAHKKWD